jgi:hypothetical protein
MSPFGFTVLGLVMLIYALFWLWNLSRLLQRKDLDPVTKLTWVVVLIFVPVFGLFYYRDQVPEPALERRSSRAFSTENPFPAGPD